MTPGLVSIAAGHRMVFQQGCASARVFSWDSPGVSSMQQDRDGFTLIELLVVVAIIGILAMIAITNMLAARTKASVARVEADLHALATALESYYVDNEIFPDSEVGSNSRAWKLDPPVPGRDKPHPQHGFQYYPGHTVRSLLTQLTSPVAYISHVNMNDPFLSPQKPLKSDNEAFRWPESYLYFGFGTGKPYWGLRIKHHGYLVSSVGPDSTQNYLEHMIDQKLNRLQSPDRQWRIYSPTNGLRSVGDLYRIGGITGFFTGGGH